MIAVLKKKKKEILNLREREEKREIQKRHESKYSDRDVIYHAGVFISFPSNYVYGILLSR